MKSLIIFVKFLFFSVLGCLIIYYIFSPYQNCLRDFDSSSTNVDLSYGTPDQIQTHKREMLIIAKDGHKSECYLESSW